MVIPTGNSTYLRIPLPQFFRAFYGMGANLGDVIHGQSTIDVAAGRGTVNFINAMSPVDITAFFEKQGKWYAPFIPTIAKPISEVVSNRDFMGYPIYKEAFTKELEDKLADSGMHKKNVNVVIKFITDSLFKLGGGEATDDKRSKYYFDENQDRKRVKEIADWNPSKVEHLLKTYTGGTGAVITDFTNLISLSTGGNFTIDNVPLINSFFRKFPERRITAVGDYYDMKNDNKGFFSDAKAKKGTDYEMYMSLMKNRKQNEIKNVLNQSENELDRLTKMFEAEKITLDDYLDKRGEIMENAMKQIKE
jgi:hypothetical protein